MMPTTATDMLQHTVWIAGIALFSTFLLTGCDQWSTGYLLNRSRDTVTVRLRHSEYHRTGDSAGFPTYSKQSKWGVVRLGPRQSFEIGRNMGPTFRECRFDSLEASGPGFSMQLSGDNILRLPMEEDGYSYYYLVGWSRDTDE